MYNIAIIAGDGIGKEVMDASEYLLDKLDLNFNFKYGEAGFDCFNKNGTTLPEETIKIAKSSDATLFGASTSTPGQPSPIINLRKQLDVYANLRPIKSYVGVKSIENNIDFIHYDNLKECLSETYKKADKKDPHSRKRSIHIVRRTCSSRRHHPHLRLHSYDGYSPRRHRNLAPHPLFRGI